MLFRAPVLVLPLVGCVPLQDPEAAQAVALVVLQVRVLLAPAFTLVGLALMETDGNIGAGGVAISP